jgi:hypothetical protein
MTHLQMILMTSHNKIMIETMTKAYNTFLGSYSLFGTLTSALDLANSICQGPYLQHLIFL